MVQLRNYSFPMLSASMGKCEGSITLAQQATTFPPRFFAGILITGSEHIMINSHPDTDDAAADENHDEEVVAMIEESHYHC